MTLGQTVPNYDKNDYKNSLFSILLIPVEAKSNVGTTGCKKLNQTAVSQIPEK